MSIYKKIIILSKHLAGYKDINAQINNLLKIATPLEGFVSMRPNEAVRFQNFEDGEAEILNDGPKGERTKVIYKDKRHRLSEEESAEDLQNWFDSIEFLSDKIILIPFNSSEVESDDSILTGLSAIFGEDPTTYVDLKRKASILGPSSFSSPSGNLDVLKDTFPELWQDIETILNSKKLDEDEVVYILYNQEDTNKNDLINLIKDSHYFAHDLGHAVFDFNDGDMEFKFIIQMAMQKILNEYSQYADYEDDYEEARAEEEPLGDLLEVDGECLEHSSAYFFGPVTDLSFDISNDVPGDLFAAATSGKLRAEPIRDDIYLMSCNTQGVSNNVYLKSDASRQIIQSIVDDCIKKLNAYVRQPGTVLRQGGQVLLYDL